jgi:hypothetical protein
VRPPGSVCAAVLVAVATLLTGCDGRSPRVAPKNLPPSSLPQGVSPLGAFVTASVTSSREGHLTVPGIGTLAWSRAAFQGDGILVAQPVRVEHPPSTIDGVPIGSLGKGLLVTTKNATIAAPLTVTFPDAVAPRGGAVIAVHRDDSGHWSLLPNATTPAGGGIAVSTATFSIVTWAESKIFKPIGDFLADKVEGRTQPSVCAAAPVWASVDGNPSGSTHSCVRTGTPLADGTQIAELEIKSNRGTYQWVQLPSTLTREYVWVEDENDFVRSLVDATFHQSSTILLAPGKRLTIGYREPATPTQLRFHTYVDDRTAGLSLLHLALDAVVGKGVDSIGGWLAVLKCSKTLDIDPTNLNNPVALHWPDLALTGTRCIYDTARDFAAHPARAAEVAGELLGSDVNPDTLTSATTDLFKLGRFAALIGRALNLGTYIAKEVSFITDALDAGTGASNATDVTLTLDASRVAISSIDASLTRALRAVDTEVPQLRGLVAGTPEGGTGDAAAATLYRNGVKAGTAVFIYGVADNSMNLIDWSTTNRAACENAGLWDAAEHANDFGCTSTAEPTGPCPTELLSNFDAAAPPGWVRHGDCTTYADDRWAVVSYVSAPNNGSGGWYWRNLKGTWEPATSGGP